MNKKQISQQVEEAVKESIPSRVEIPVYEKFKGKQMHGSGTWQANTGTTPKRSVKMSSTINELNNKT